VLGDDGIERLVGFPGTRDFAEIPPLTRHSAHAGSIRQDVDDGLVQALTGAARPLANGIVDELWYAPYRVLHAETIGRACSASKRTAGV
jgi:hypothetical protein